MADQEVEDALARSFLAGLPPELVDGLRDDGERTDYPAGTTVYRAGSDPRAALVVRGLPPAPLRHPQAALLVAADVAALDAAAAGQRLRHRAHQGADPVRHRAGPRLGHRRRLLPRRRHRLPVRPPRPLRYRRG